MAEPTVPVPAVRPPVDKPMRLVGVSHSNNSYSLVDHASSANEFHHVLDIVRQNLMGKYMCRLSRNVFISFLYVCYILFDIYSSWTRANLTLVIFDVHS